MAKVRQTMSKLGAAIEDGLGEIDVVRREEMERRGNGGLEGAAP
jgi:hypothetical protein